MQKEVTDLIELVNDLISTLVKTGLAYQDAYAPALVIGY